MGFWNDLEEAVEKAAKSTAKAVKKAAKSTAKAIGIGKKFTVKALERIPEFLTRDIIARLVSWLVDLVIKYFSG